MQTSDKIGAKLYLNAWQVHFNASREPRIIQLPAKQGLLSAKWLELFAYSLRAPRRKIYNLARCQYL